MRISDWSSDVCSSDLLEQTMLWERGVDHALFRPDRAPHPAFADLPRPIQLYVGRVAVEKNIEAFLDASHPGTKVIVGDGPALPDLGARYPEIGRASCRERVCQYV